MKSKLLQVRVDSLSLDMLEYLKRINGYKSISDTIRKTIEKEYRKENEVKSIINNAREEIEDIVCNKETNTDKAQGMLNALNIMLKYVEDKDLIEIPSGATRKEVHKLLFGIEPPELDSPYCACANANGGKGCETCIHKDDSNCDVNWWNTPFKK